MLSEQWHKQQQQRIEEYELRLKREKELEDNNEDFIDGDAGSFVHHGKTFSFRLQDTALGIKCTCWLAWNEKAKTTTIIHGSIGEAQTNQIGWLWKKHHQEIEEHIKYQPKD